MSYYNTIPVPKTELKEKKQRARRQEDIILEFLGNRGGAWTPAEIWLQCFHNSIPLTSVRRAITDLTKSGKLRKTGKLADGIYGDKNNTWELVPNNK